MPALLSNDDGSFIGVGPCHACGRLFAFNVDLVPTIVLKGERHEICKRCVDDVNEARAAKGFPPAIDYAEEAYPGQ